MQCCFNVKQVHARNHIHHYGGRHYLVFVLNGGTGIYFTVINMIIAWKGQGHSMIS